MDAMASEQTPFDSRLRHLRRAIAWLEVTKLGNVKLDQRLDRYPTRTPYRRLRFANNTPTTPSFPHLHITSPINRSLSPLSHVH